MQNDMSMEFCVSMAAKVISDEVEKGSNVVLSPISNAIVLNMLSFGSNGQTLDQFLSFLGPQETNQHHIDLIFPPKNPPKPPPPPLPLPLPPVFNPIPGPIPIRRPGEIWENPIPSPIFHMSDSVVTVPNQPFQHLEKDPIFTFVNVIQSHWVIPFLKTSFLDKATSLYDVFPYKTDLFKEQLKVERVKSEMNSWAKIVTNELIKCLLSPTVDLSPPICIVNALYLRAAWKIPFIESNTRNQDFQLLNGQTIKTLFMNMRNECHWFNSYQHFKLLRLPYQNFPSSKTRLAMYIFLPHQKQGLADLVNAFNSDPSKLNPKLLALVHTEVTTVSIPKFKFWSCFDAKEAFRHEGLTLPFDRENADFSNMIEGSEKGWIGGIVSNAFVEVNEIGTENVEALVSPELFRVGLGPIEPPKKTFVADHPFMFMIVDDTSNSIVFVGAVINPIYWIM